MKSFTQYLTESAGDPELAHAIQSLDQALQVITHKLGNHPELNRFQETWVRIKPLIEKGEHKPLFGQWGQ